MASKTVKIPEELVELVEKTEGDSDRIGQRLFTAYQSYARAKVCADVLKEKYSIDGDSVDEIILNFIRETETRVESIAEQTGEARDIARGLLTVFRNVL